MGRGARHPGPRRGEAPARARRLKAEAPGAPARRRGPWARESPARAGSTAAGELERPVHHSPGRSHIRPAPPGLVISRRRGPRGCTRASTARCSRRGCCCSPASPPPTPGAPSRRRRGRCVLATALCNLRGPVHARREAGPLQVRAASEETTPPTLGQTRELQATGRRSSERKQQRQAAAGAG